MKKIVFILCSIISVGAFSQSPWVHEKGSGYTHLSFGIIPPYSSVFKGDWSNLQELNYQITEFSAQSYTEVGLGKKLELTSSIPLRFISLTEVIPSSDNTLEEGSLIGLGGVDLGLKYNVLDKGVVLSTALQVNIPTASKKEESGLRTSYEYFSFIPTVSAGKGWNKSYGYAYIGAGIFDELSSDIRFGVEYGYKFKDRFWTILNFSARESFENNSLNEGVYNETFLFVNNQSYNSLSLKLIYELNEKVGLNASTNLISLTANNLPFQRPISLGAYFKW